jgi:opacity protein-like surface antigen
MVTNTFLMGKLPVLTLAMICALASSAQRFHIGVFGGLAAYNGDLTDKIFPKKVTNGAIGITGNYELTDNIMLRAGYTFARVGGADRFSDNPEMLKRNLAFETAISEFSLVGEYYLLNLYDNRFSPYAFIGLAAYHFNPYAYNNSDDKIFLKPLSTEGQGLAGYPKPYSLTQLSIPFGIGVKYAVTDKLHIGLEGSFHKLFTDYFDDVSNVYADPNDLLAGRGQLSVDMSYRGDEVPGGDPTYPVKGYQRGGADKKDFYYFTGLHLTYRLGNGSSRLSGGGRNSTGCPTNVY